MPRHRSAKNNNHRLGPLNSASQNVPQRRHNSLASAGDAKNRPAGHLPQQSESVKGIENVKPILDDVGPQQPSPSASSANNSQSISSSTAALHDELDSFRQRWRRELETSKKSSDILDETSTGKKQGEEDKPKRPSSGLKDFHSVVNHPPDDPEEVYNLARKLFLMGVELEQDELHNESIRYYKQAINLCPDIEKQIFREQCEASKMNNQASQPNLAIKTNNEQVGDNDEEKLPLVDRIKQAFYDNLSRDQSFAYCRPVVQKSQKTKHISDLPHDLLIQIFRYVIGTELDLASLETLAMVCRGFHVLAHDASLWRSICHSTWTKASLLSLTSGDNKATNIVDWKQVYLEKSRVNCDGVYISRTKYIRQGDVGFQDITYRPFHVVRYYRYLRFFPDNRVLILTTNEEPDKIIPIFRHANDSKQFSSELSILDGTYELVNEDEIVIKAEKDFTSEHNQSVQQQQQQQQQQQTYNQRRQARFHWSRQTPQWQRFDLKFKLKTLDSRPFRNNTLKWLEYSILSRTELGQELTEFDLTPDTFPNLAFSRVKRFNLRSSQPLASH